MQVNSMYDYYDSVEKRYNNLYSLGGEVERSFYQNIGKIFNKEAIYHRQDEPVNKMYANIEKIMLGEKKE